MSVCVSPDLLNRIEPLAGGRILRAVPLGGGCVAQVVALMTAEGPGLVAKIGRPGDRLDLEGRMLAHLGAAGVPVPRVLLAGDDLLVMTRVAAEGSLRGRAEEHLADILVALHSQPQAAFGLAYDTVIGGLPQPNPISPRWVPFYAEHRLVAMARVAQEAGRLPSALRRGVEDLAQRLDGWLDEPAHPSLIHGDLWGGNILCDRRGVAALIDPAIYHADPEVELAFGTLFGTLGERFFARYQEQRPLAPGFFELRRDLYTLYPLLVHVRLFGGSYVDAVARTVRRFGSPGA